MADEKSAEDGSPDDTKVLMEGFLFKKGGGTGILGSGIGGRTNWLRRWFVLQNEYLHYYENFDRSLNDGHGAPVNKKGVVPIHNCVVSTHEHRERQHCFVIEHKDRRAVYLHAANSKLMGLWVDALRRASKLEFHQKVNLQEHYAVLGLDGLEYSDEVLPRERDLVRAYRKACMKNHPDKGGDPDHFDRIQQAHELLQSVLEREQEKNLFEEVRFSVKIEKGPKGVGLGLIVQEDKKRQGIVVTKVTPTIRCAIETDGVRAIQADDMLVGIGNEDITDWPLNRVTERLNDFRVPVGDAVRVAFLRRQRRVMETMADDFGELGSDCTSDDVVSPGRASAGEPAVVEKKANSASESAVEAQKPRAIPQQDLGSASSETFPDEPLHIPARNDNVSFTVGRTRSASVANQIQSEAGSVDAHGRGIPSWAHRRIKELEDTCERLENEWRSAQKQMGTVELDMLRFLAFTPRTVDTEAASPERGELVQGRGASLVQAKRKAVQAALAADVSGNVLNKWVMTSDDAMKKLSRLERRLQGAVP